MADAVSDDAGGPSTRRLRSWVATGVIAVMAFNVLLALVQAYLPIIFALTALVLIVRVLWALTR